MVSLVNFYFDAGPEIEEVRTWIDRHNRPKAIEAAKKHLRNGYNSRSFLDLVADLLDDQLPASGPSRWLAVGSRFEELREKDPVTGERIRYEDALQIVAKEEGMTVPTIRRRLKFYRDAHRYYSIDDD